MRAQDSSLRALWSGAVPRYSLSPRWLKKDKDHGQASPHRAHRSRSGKGRQVFRGRVRHESGGEKPPRGLRLPPPPPTAPAPPRKGGGREPFFTLRVGVCSLSGGQEESGGGRAA